MNNNLILQIKFWFLAIILASSTFFSYFRYVSTSENDFSSKAMPITYILFFLVTILLFGSKKVELRQVWHSIFIFGIIFLNFLFMIRFGLPKYYYMFGEYISGIQIFLVSLIGLLVIHSGVINKVLNRYYFIAFLFGLYYILQVSLGDWEKNQYLNENTWGLFLAPFLIYLFIVIKTLKYRIPIYLIGALLLFMSGAKTTFFAFITIPILMFVFNKVKKPRLIYTIFICTGLLLVYIIASVDNGAITKILTYRNILWGIYLDNVQSSFSTFIGGTGLWKTEFFLGVSLSFLTGMGAHNTFISLLHYNGIIVLILYVVFIIFGMRRRSNKFTVSDGILYFAITFQFAESNVPIFSYIFPSVIFLINILINKEIDIEDTNKQFVKDSN